MIPTPLSALLFALALTSCSTVHEKLGVPGGSVLQARVQTHDGARITLWRWTPTDADAPRLLVVPELGFDHQIVAPLCERLRARGFDVWSLDGRQLTDPAAPQGWGAWHADVARAAKAMGEGGAVLAIGVGGEAALSLSQVMKVRGIVAVNTPQAHEAGNAALEKALKEDGFAPDRWLRDAYGDLLLGAGRQTPDDARRALKHSARPLPEALRRDVAALFATRAPVARAPVPLRLLAGLKDNLVSPEHAFDAPGLAPTSLRRLGLIELFARDYGHLDWLADPAALDDVAPVIAAELERLP